MSLVSEYCPKCQHHQTKHAGGTCYICWTIDCMVQLGDGNKWGLPNGWYTGAQLNAASSSMRPEDRPYLVFHE